MKVKYKEREREREREREIENNKQMNLATQQFDISPINILIYLSVNIGKCNEAKTYL